MTLESELLKRELDVLTARKDFLEWRLAQIPLEKELLKELNQVSKRLHELKET